MIIELITSLQSNQIPAACLHMETGQGGFFG